jgi:hypothetical protein
MADLSDTDSAGSVKIIGSNTSGVETTPVNATVNGGLHINLRDNAGTESGTSGNPLRVDPTGSTIQPISGTITANAGTNLNTSALALETTQTTTNTRIGDLVETAPATDTASSGLNGRLQRIAQRLTSIFTAQSDGTQQSKIRGATDGTLIGNLGTSLNANVTKTVNNTDSNVAGGISALNGTASLSSNGASVMMINITGTWVATLTLRATTGDGLYQNISAIDVTTGLFTGTVTTPTTLKVPCAGWSQILLIATAYTSGTANITLNAGVGNYVPPVDGFGRPLMSRNSKTPTYSASIIGVAPAATATDIFRISGSASKTITVKKIGFSSTATATSINNILLIKRSTANTGGTSATATNVPYDSTNAAASATVVTYTANPTLGTAVGNVRSAKVVSSIGTGSTNDNTEWIFEDSGAQGILLRGTAEGLSINLNSTTITGGSFNFYVEWLEE